MLGTSMSVIGQNTKVVSESALLGSAAASPRDRRRAVAVASLLVAAFVVTAPVSSRLLPALPAFLPTYDAAVIILDLITAVLLYAQYRELKERSLLALACGYAFTPPLVTAHGLAFPDAFGPGSVIGGSQTTAWLWMAWHGFFPFFVGAYALLARRERQHVLRSVSADARRPQVFALLGTLALAASLILLTTAGESLLPELMLGSNYRSSFTRLILSLGWGAHLVALGLLLWATRGKRVIDLWVAVTLLANVIDLALSGILITGRYQLGWYAGRFYGLLASSFILTLLLRQAVGLHGGLARTIEALRMSEARLATFFAFAPVGLSELALDGRVLRVNDELCRILGRPREEWLRLGVAGVTHPDDLAQTLAVAAEVAAGGGGRALDKRYLRPDGTVVWANLRGTLLHHGEGLPDTVLVVTTDLTERKRAEEALRESEEKYRKLFDSIDEGFCIIELIFDDAGRPVDFRCVEANMGFERQTGRRPQPGQTMRELFPEAEDMWLDTYAEVVRTGVPQRFIDYNEGLDRWYDVFVSPTSAPKEKMQLAALFSDVTDRKRAEKLLRESEDRLRRAIEIDTVGVMFFKTDGQITYGNDAFLRMTGYSREDAEKGLLRWDVMTPPEFMPQSLNAVQEFLKYGRTTPYEKQYIRKDGSRWWALFSATRVSDGEGVEFIVDITERKRAEEALRRAHEELEQKVLERTRELREANVQLQAEIAERKQAEAARAEALQRLVTAQEDERRRISRELHDTLGQYLTALQVGLQTVKEQDGCPADVTESITRMQALALRMDEEVERLSFELRPPALDDLGLEDALRRHVQEWSASSGIAADLHTKSLDHQRLPTSLETAVYRVVQEALTNVRKHARATSVSLIVERRREEVLAIIEDDGCGFDPDAVKHARGSRYKLGLVGMLERAALAGGRLDIESAPGAGTTIYLHVPILPNDRKETPNADD
jgi:PAS domain S-box-containing protein